MNVVVDDSSGWLEYLADGPNADFFAPAIEARKTLVVPTISIFEVFKRVLLQRGEGAALQAVALMQQGQIVELTGALALAAAHLSADLKLPMADSYGVSRDLDGRSTLASRVSSTSASSRTLARPPLAGPSAALRHTRPAADDTHACRRPSRAVGSSTGGRRLRPWRCAPDRR